MAVLDVRPFLDAGQEPFPQIMGAVEKLEKGEPLFIIAPFEPAPLYKLMKEKGFDHFSMQLPDGSWQVKFVKS